MVIKLIPEVEVIKGNKLIKRTNQKITQLRVAPYCRVSTDKEDQAKSYQNQLLYYRQLVKERKDWDLVKIYTDEAVTGTRDDLRDGFIEMIQDCKDGLIDLVITKSIPRFARNTVDTLRYVRLLKEMGIAVFFEAENINTLTMDGEMLLTILSSVAQQEVENISTNVKKGLKMKMKRGELIGFNEALGYNYDKETKSISVNPEEAEIVRYIFRRYLEGFGAYTIARELTELNYPTPRGLKKWHNGTVLGIIKNEKYKGDLLQGKTFTLDPISKKRLDNLGEEDMFYAKNTHEAIIGVEDWDKANTILKSRSRPQYNKNGAREKHSNKYSFSSLCECGFCGGKLYRRSWNGGTKYNKPVWLCSTAINERKIACPHCKSIPETILEGAFLKSYNLLCTEKDGVLDEFINRLEKVLSDNEIDKELKRFKNKHSKVINKRSKLTDMMLENVLDDVEFKLKYEELTSELLELENEINKLEDIALSEREKKYRIEKFKKILEEQDEITEFDGEVLESTIEKIIVGEMEEDGNTNPYKIAFVYKTGDTNKITTSLEDQKSQSESLCSNSTDNTCRGVKTNIKIKYVEILSFQYFERYWMMDRKPDAGLRKEINNQIDVSVLVDIDLVTMIKN